MDEQTLAKATDPFFTTKVSGKGTGLGLSMVAGMAEQFGGTLRLKSVVGEGTTVTLWLPVAASETTSAPLVASTSKTARSLKAMTVLAVDDDDIVLANIAEMLKDLGHTVLQASSGSQALQLLGQNRVDLLITDYAMAGMRGDELADAVRVGWPEMPTLILSGYAELPADIALHFHRLPKPFLQHELAAALAAVMQQGPSGDILQFRPHA